MKVGSLFSGYSGLDLAVETFFDAETVWHVEFDEAPSKILAHHYPDTPNYGDITKVDWSQVEPVDILTGGFPCQDVSLAGQRKGLKDGTRSGLWSEFAKAIDELRPKIVVIENVRGLLSAEAHSDMEPCEWCLGDGSSKPALRALGAVLGDLSDLGYDAEWLSVRAADAGAPHNRFRVFIVAYPNGERGRGRSSKPSVGAVEESDGSVEVPDFGADRKHLDLLPTPTTQDAKNTGGESQFERNTLPLNTEVLTFDGWGRYEPAIRRWEQVLGRVAPSPTEPSKAGKAQLSAKFVEFLMGLPPGWVTSPEIGLSRNQALKALGNGVVPQQAYLALQMLGASFDSVDD